MNLTCDVLSLISPNKKASQHDTIKNDEGTSSTKSQIEMKAWTHSVSLIAEVEYFF